MKRMRSVSDEIWLKQYYDMNQKFIEVMPIVLFSTIAVYIMELNQNSYRDMIINEVERSNEMY